MTRHVARQMEGAMIRTLIYVALGGAAGAVARFVTVTAFARLLPGSFPAGTFVVNVAGSLLMGGLAAWLAAHQAERFSPLLLSGFLGGFTTFSAFSADILRLLEGGTPWMAGGYAVASVLVSVVARMAGAALIRGLL